MERLIRTNYYQHFDADDSLQYPAENYGGWKTAMLPIEPETTAFVSMHAWYTGEPGQYPGWERCVEYIPRANRICKELLPGFFEKVRASGMRLIHVGSSNMVVGRYPGYQKTLDIVGNVRDEYDVFPGDATVSKLNSFKWSNVFVGTHNAGDVARGQKELDFNPYVKPVGDEHIAINSAQLLGLCRHYDIHHLIYTGFAINACLLISPCGFVDMTRRGIMCSSIRQLTTAVENRESRRGEKNKEFGLWYDALLFGYVYDQIDVEEMLGSLLSSR
ncbi:MAG: hypothetical protein VB118_11985 [Oscillospiraceae bacterium]|nr:hypothetical protein [Oscillospiraceae bacterium]